ncbi:conserved hypothetical protein [Burkholderia sp. 8Y]|uniref:hypothetical protein n=1 Tax=Burkholderia sp. 8Y TaxID=2653133 RepID=UPI0012F17B3E|nr:hypothetical protein [Burkholderia sp. 8Y]VXB87463.1 conserved hypothetical protein [Burkholderia sp. 8Y]
MKTPNYACVKDGAVLPSFHDAELISLEHDPGARSLVLRLKRASGPVETLLFSGVVAQRMIDFADQNVASRLLISPMRNFSIDDLSVWVRWMYSRDDAKAPEPSRAIIEQFHRDVIDGRKALFILDPSCGAEMAVLCESISILT